MAEGNSEQSFYLSSLDPGVGKTQTVVHFLNALVASPEHVDVGAVVFMFTKDEIKALAREAEAVGLPQSAFAARVHQDDLEVNALGCGDPASARILFTTHQRLVTICSDRAFGEVGDFNYHGQPRQVRIWDERLLPARDIHLSHLDIGGLYPHLPSAGERREALVRDLDELRVQLRDAENRAVLEVPDLASKHGVSGAELRKHLREKSSEVRELTTDLWHLFGIKAIVRHNGETERRLVSFRDNLPPDLAPLVILDASGRVSTTYERWEKHRGSLVRLKAGRKQYRNLTLHVWRIGGGASSFASNEGWALRRGGIVQTIKAKLSEPWLVVCHKKHEGKLRGAVMAELGWQAPVTFIHWGRHRATNEHRDIANVILAGTQFLPPSAIEGIGRAASGLAPGDGLLTETEERDLVLGAQADIILQAVCRGAARRAVDGDCGPCNVYLIAHPRHGINIERLEEVFPGCRIEGWTPVRRDPTGNVAQAIDYVLSWFKANPDGELRFPDVYNAIGMDRSNFHDLRRHDDFENALEENDIGLFWGKRNALGFCRQDEERSPFLVGTFEDYFPVQDDAET
jgi:hypothetical protein